MILSGINVVGSVVMLGILSEVERKDAREDQHIIFTRRSLDAVGIGQ